jgi:ubiquinone/menaquinone biosynthesis C-methylase UbiE
MGTEKLNRTASYWDKNVKLHESSSDIIHWLDSPIVTEHALKILKVEDKLMSVVQWLLWIKEKYIHSSVLDYGLSICCGDGTLERHALNLEICSKFDAFDISSKSIQAAKEQSIEQGMVDRINYFVDDLNNINLDRDKYDIIFSGMGLHHIKNIEYVLKELKKSTKKNGLLVLNEYVGPSQFQWTDQQLAVIKDILKLLPDRLKYDTRNQVFRERIAKPSIEHMNAVDPSEAIRSSDIIPLVYKIWKVVEQIDYGGTILHMLLDGIISNFDPDKEEDATILKLIKYIEDMMIKEKILKSDFALIVATK